MDIVEVRGVRHMSYEKIRMESKTFDHNFN